MDLRYPSNRFYPNHFKIAIDSNGSPPRFRYFCGMDARDKWLAEFQSVFRQFFALEPVSGQAKAMDQLAHFVVSRESHPLFILTGYAGTGKTTLLGAFVKALQFTKQKTVLLAPTGRAAKVLSSRSNQRAYTIHKRIYFKETKEGGGVGLMLAPNRSKNTVFIIDEASMIGGYSVSDDGHVGRNMLEDVLTYVYSGENCKLIFVGDEGQLPPVGSDFSPALNIEYLKFHFSSLDIQQAQLTEVLRQTEDSDILFNATKLRSAEKGLYPVFELSGKKDLLRIDGGALQEALEAAYDFSGPSEVMIITRSNKRANQFNQEIRNRILWREEDICGGDLLMVVKNNYYWLDEKSPAGFIANGEIVQVKRLGRRENFYGFHFIHARVELVDYPEMGDFETILWLDTLTVEAPSMSRNDLKQLFFELEREYSHEHNKRKRYEAIMKNPYMNALQVKFAYAITCHKSQGGQWEQVFLDHGYLTDDMLDEGFFRWMYTGFTRASEKLYLLNFDRHFFPTEQD